MCVGALVHARIDQLVFGAREPRSGAVVSQQNLLDSASLNHKVRYQEGVLAEECGKIMQAFFNPDAECCARCWAFSGSFGLQVILQRSST